MKRFVFTIALLSVFFNVFSQNELIDSLENILEIQTEKERIETLLELSANFVRTDVEKSLNYSNEARKLTEELKLPEFKSNVYNSLALISYFKSEFDNCIINAKKAIDYAEKYKNEEQKAISYKYCGIVYQLKSNYDSAMIFFEKEKEFHLNHENKSELALCYYNIGVIYQITGNYTSALTKYLLAKEIFDELGERSRLITIYGNIGALYIEQGNFEEAERYLKKSEIGNVENNNFVDAARNCNVMGIMFRKQKEYEKALNKYEKALDYLLIQPNKHVEIAIYSNIGVVYNDLEKYEKAIEYLKKSAKIAEELNLTTNIAVAYHNIGEAYFKQQKYLQALENYLKAHDVFIETKRYSEILKSYKALIKTNKMLNKPDLALEYYEKYDFLKDSLTKAERSFSLDSLQTVFETKYLKSENLLLEKNAEIKKKTITNQRILIFSVITILILVGILFIFIIRNSRIMKRFIKELSEKNKEISKQSEELRLINNKLAELSDFKEGMMQMIIHDLKNPLNTLQNIRLYDSEKQIEKVETTSQTMLNLIQDILDVYKYENSIMKLNLENISGLNLIQASVKEISAIAEGKSIKIEKNIDKSLGVNCDYDIINRVMINLLTNAIKYSSANSVIKIEVAKNKINPEEVDISVTNQGEEIPKEYLGKIFDKFTQSGKNAKKYSSGLGLSFCKLAVESHGKKISVSSEKNTTRFSFSLTKSKNVESKVSQINENENTVTTLSENEKSFLKPFLKELSEIPIYKISAINSVIERIKNENNSEEISILCAKLFELASKGKEDLYIKKIRELQT